MNAIDPFLQYRLTRVINASGTMTSLGASRAGDEVIEAAATILPHFVRIDELQARASEVIAAATGAEGGCVTASAAAGMALAVAAVMTRDDLARIERLPDAAGLKSEVVIGAGHLVNYGAPVAQAIALTGACVVSAGTAARVESYHLEDVICEHTAAVLFVVSHHVVQEGQSSLEETIAIAHRLGVPVVVDMAAEYDLTGPFEKGPTLRSGARTSSSPARPPVLLPAARTSCVRCIFRIAASADT